MNKDILFIFVIFILIILGIYFVFINNGLSDNSAFNNLSSLKQTTQIVFSNIKEEKFIYKYENGDQSDISGMSFSASNISNEASDEIRKYFEDNGFNIDFFEIGSDLAGTSYYSKNKDVCMVKISVLIDEEGLPESSNKLNANIFCGELAN